MEQTFGYEVILDALVLKIAVHCLNELQVGKSETDQFIRGFVLIQGDHEWPIESIMTKQFQLLRIVIPRQCLF